MDQLVNRSMRIARGLTYPIFLELNRIGPLFGEHTRLFEERWRFPALSCQICDGEEQTQLLKNILEAAGFVSFMVVLCFVSGRWVLYITCICPIPLQPPSKATDPRHALESSHPRSNNEKANR